MKLLKISRWASYLCSSISSCALLILCILHFFTRDCMFRDILLILQIGASLGGLILLVTGPILKEKYPHTEATPLEVKLYYIILTITFIALWGFTFITAIQKELVFHYPNGSDGYHALTLPLFGSILPVLSLSIWHPSES